MKVAFASEAMLDCRAQPVTEAGLAYGGGTPITARFRPDRSKHPIADAAARRS